MMTVGMRSLSDDAKLPMHLGKGTSSEPLPSNGQLGSGVTSPAA